MNNVEGILLTDKQLKGLEKLGEDTKRKPSWIARLFDWIDYNILSRTTKIWVYCLEIVGIIALFMVLDEFKTGLELIRTAKDALELQKAKVYMDAVITSAPSLATMIAVIGGALPGLIGALRTLKKKWINGYANGNGHANKEEDTA